MTFRSRQPLPAGAVLAAALAVEFADELVDGTQGAALPLIRHDLALSYGQIGLLASVPLLLGSLLELPVGVLAGHGRRRRVAVLAGGVMFIASLVAAATAHSFATLLIAFVLFFPASGAFVSLTQSGLMDADPGRPEQHMARWNLAGSAGAVAGPLLLIAVLAGGGDWRAGYLALAGFATLAWLGIARHGPRAPAAADHPGEPGEPGEQGDPGEPGGAGALRRLRGALRQAGVVRWLVLLEVADLLLDVLTGFLAIYLVDVVHATPAQAALGVTVLLVAGFWPKLVVLAGLSIATAPWYPVLQASLYGSLPGQSGVAVTLTSAAGPAGGAGPLAAGFLAERFGLSWALAGLAIAPVCMLAGLRWRPARRRSEERRVGK